MRLFRAWLVLALLLSGNVLALGLGDIRLSSALNEPLRARIELLSATPEELEGLKVRLASQDTFSRYGIDRPPWLTRLQFEVVGSGNGAAVEVSSQEPITEPFVTFLVEASWPSGRLLREYTVLLDPPTFAPPPAAAATESVTAPSRAAPADAGRIERPAAPEAAPEAAPREPAQTRTPSPRPAAPEPAPAADTGPFDTAPGGDVQVQRGDTLWGIAQRVRPDERLSMNQTMLGIYEANPQAFAGNINRLEAGARLRVPSADEIFRISRSDAMSEVQRQNQAVGIADAAPRTQPSLTLVPPDGEQEDYGAAATAQQPQTGAGQAATQQRVRELENTVSDQQSLLEIRDRELAQLREELARMRQQAGAQVETPGSEQPALGETPGETPDEVFAEDPDAAGEEPSAVEETPPPAEQPRVVRTADEPGLIERIVEALTGIWGLIGLAVLLAIVLLLWLAKRATGRDEESTGVWEALDVDDDEDAESRASTERLRALARDDDASIVVVEQESAVERRRRDRDLPEETAQIAGGETLDETLDETSDTGAMPELDDTFSSDTALNLDQSDPIAEADFHMAYGLYDQAADLISGALAVDPERQDLMAKLAEIYFVWGNRDGFIEAASRMHDQLGGESTPDWDKIVIMGRQLAPEHRLFAGASATAATRAVDLSFDESGNRNVLDVDFDAGGPDGTVSDVSELGADKDTSSADQSGLDFVFEDSEAGDEQSGATTAREVPPLDALEDATVESPTVESRGPEQTLEAQTIESPTVEQPRDGLDSTSELPAFSDADREPHSGDATEEIDLDDLGLDLDALDPAELEDLGDDDDFGASDPEATRETRALDADWEEDRDGEDLESTSEVPLASEETAEHSPGEREDAEVDFDASLLDATGQTQILPDDFDADAHGDRKARPEVDEDATVLAPLEDEDEDDSETGQFPGDEDFDFDEAGALSGERDEQETGEMPAGDDPDLEDLTAALRTDDFDAVGATGDEETVEQPLTGTGADDELHDYGVDDDAATEAPSPEDVSDELHEARTMTEVGTKLDLARAYVDMGDPEGARSILEEVLDEGDEGQRQQAQKLIDSLPE